MSHLIQYTLPLEGKSMLEFQQKTFIKPNFKAMVRSSTQPNLFNIDEELLDNFCNKLSDKEIYKMDKENYEMYQHYKQKLKSRKKCTFPSGSQIIQNIFTRDEDRTDDQIQQRKTKNHINLLKYLKKMPQKVNLHQKYNNAINQKVSILAEAKEILKNKQTFRKWANQNKNSPVKNPNFTKMTFLLQKITADKSIVRNLQDQPFEPSQERFKKILNTTTKNPHQGHKKSKSGIPNLTLEPLSTTAYHTKTHNRWVDDSRDIRETVCFHNQK